MQKFLDKDMIEVRDLLSISPDATLKACCDIAGVPYDNAEQPPATIITILTSDNIENTVSKIKDFLKSQNLTVTAPNLGDAITPSDAPLPSSDIPRKMDPYYRELASTQVKVQTPSADMAISAMSTATNAVAVNTYAYLGVSNGWAVLSWHSPNPENYDWVGLYNDQAKGQNSYLTWQWVKGNTEYISNQYFVTGLSVRYFRYHTEDAAYHELYRSGDLDFGAVMRAADEKKLIDGCWISAAPDGNTTLNWTVNPNVDYDYVALFRDNSNNYITGQWNWASFLPPYESSYGLKPGYHARYYQWNVTDKKYVCKHSSVPVSAYYLDINSLYLRGDNEHSLAKRSADNAGLSDSILGILVNQLSRAIAGEPSIFSLGFAPSSGFPFGAKNLLWTNLSYDEILVISNKLSVTQYKQCIMIYYQTYKMAIDIAEDEERNAKRHVFWQISMAQAFGEEFALAIGAAHETGRPGSTADNAADEYNNKLAIKYWKENPNISAMDAANTLWKNGSLKKVVETRLKDEL